jgi:hypothetical protein
MSGSIVPDRGGVLDVEHLAIAGMVMTTPLTPELDVIHDAAVVEIVLGCRIVRLIEKRELQWMLMPAFEALQR